MELSNNANQVLFSIQHVCRLCSSKYDLVSVYDEKLNLPPQNMRDIVFTTTTIKIVTGDNVSQKICTKCVAVAIKMFQFRDQSIRNDKYLKGQYEEISKLQKIKTATTVSPASTSKKKIDGSTENKKMELERSEKEVENKSAKPRYKIHPSISALFRIYPNIRVPSACLKYDINPNVVMEMDAVENYFKIRKLNMQRYVNGALKKLNRFAVKSTSADSKRVKCSTSYTLFKTVKKFKSIEDKPIEIDLTEDLKDSDRLSNKSDKDAQKTRVNRSTGSPIPTSNQTLQRTGKRKRKYSTDSSSQPSVKKSSISGTTNPVSPAPLSDSVPNLSFARSKELHVCNLCNSVHYQAKDLKKHQQTHLRCQFCKIKFKTLKIKEKHLESECKIQKAMKSMTNPPDIPLQKIENNLEVREKFHSALAEFKLVEEDSKSPKPIPNVIEIHSDEQQTKKKASITSFDSDNINPDVTVADRLHFLNDLLFQQDTDIKLVKNLLLQYKKLHRKVNDVTQTFLPTNEFVKLHQGDTLAEMKYLKQHLYYYKIPIEIKHGSLFHMCYKRDTGVREPKNFHHWNDLVPVDVNFSNHEAIQNVSVGLEISREIKEEILTAHEDENTRVEEILVEEIYNQSLPILQLADKNIQDINTEESVQSPNDLVFRRTADFQTDFQQNLAEEISNSSSSPLNIQTIDNPGNVSSNILLEALTYAEINYLDSSDQHFRQSSKNANELSSKGNKITITDAMENKHTVHPKEDEKGKTKVNFAGFKSSEIIDLDSSDENSSKASPKTVEELCSKITTSDNVANKSDKKIPKENESVEEESSSSTFNIQTIDNLENESINTHLAQFKDAEINYLGSSDEIPAKNTEKIDKITVSTENENPKKNEIVEQHLFTSRSSTLNIQIIDNSENGSSNDYLAAVNSATNSSESLPKNAEGESCSKDNEIRTTDSMEIEDDKQNPKGQKICNSTSSTVNIQTIDNAENVSKYPGIIDSDSLFPTPIQTSPKNVEDLCSKDNEITITDSMGIELDKIVEQEISNSSSSTLNIQTIVNPENVGTKDQLAAFKDTEIIDLESLYPNSKESSPKNEEKQCSKRDNIITSDTVENTNESEMHDSNIEHLDLKTSCQEVEVAKIDHLDQYFSERSVKNIEKVNETETSNNEKYSTEMTM